MVTIIAIPFGSKLLVGIVCDNVPILGSTKKNYLILSGIVAFLLITPCGLFDIKSPYVFIALITTTTGCVAIMDVVLDGLMVISARIDPQNGSQDLQSLCWLSGCIAGMTGYIVGGIFTHLGYSRQAFLIMTGLFLITNIQACFLDKELEGETSQLVSKLSQLERIKLNIVQIKSALKTKELTNVFIFVLIQGGLLPRYDDYVYYYLTDEKYLGVDKMTYGLIKVLSFLGTFIGVVVYSYFFKQTPIRTLMVIATSLNVLSGILMTIFLKEIYFGINPLVFVGLVQMFSDAFSMAFTSMP